MTKLIVLIFNPKIMRQTQLVYLFDMHLHKTMPGHLYSRRYSFGVANKKHSHLNAIPLGTRPNMACVFPQFSLRFLSAPQPFVWNQLWTFCFPPPHTTRLMVPYNAATYFIVPSNIYPTLSIDVCQANGVVPRVHQIGSKVCV